jgi:hypothetical protein
VSLHVFIFYQRGININHGALFLQICPIVETTQIVAHVLP